MSKKRIIILILIFIGVWYFWGKDWYSNRAVQQNNQAGVEEEAVVKEKAVRPVDENAVTEGIGESLAKAGQAVAHFFTKEELAGCSTKTIGAVYDIDSKFGHPAAGALVEMTRASSGKTPGDYVTSILSGTRLLSLKIDKDGKAIVDYNAVLIKDLDECKAKQRRAQIEHTIQEFPKVKAVEITVDGQVWE